MADDHYDAVICGAGVGGLTLARFLGMHGRRVLLLDKQRRFRMAHKGELIQPATLAVLAEAGLLDVLLDAGALEVDALACREPDGSPLVALDYRRFSTGAHRHGLVLSYREMLEALAARLGPTVEFRRGACVQGLLRADDGRIAGVHVSHDGSRDGRTTAVPAAVTVACDGQGSRLRSAAGIRVSPRRYDHHLVGFELEDVPAVGSDMNAFLTPRGLRALFDLPGKRARLYVQIPAGSLRGVGRAGLPAWAGAMLAGMPVLQDYAEPLYRGLETVQVLSASRFIAPRWVEPGFALLGDAAHCVHPMVGQGMNAAIRDAWHLSRALVQSDSAATPSVDAALDRYEAGRRPEVEFTARMSHNLATLLTSTHPVGGRIRPAVLRRNQANLRVRRIITQNVAGLSAQPFSARDWLSASGLLGNPFRRAVPDRPDSARRAHDEP